MDTANILIGIGAALVLAGVVLSAIEAMQSGRLSDATSRSSDSGATLEPTHQSRMFSFRRLFPGLVLIAAGVIFLIVASLL
jgi:hypothetical protein